MYRILYISPIMEMLQEAAEMIYYCLAQRMRCYKEKKVMIFIFSMLEADKILL